MVRQLVANGWLLGTPEKYNRELALYEVKKRNGMDKKTKDWEKTYDFYAVHKP